MFILQIAPGIVYVAPDMHRKYPGTFLEGVSMINRRKKVIKRQLLFFSAWVIGRNQLKKDYMYLKQFNAWAFIILFYSEGAVFGNISVFFIGACTLQQ